MEKQKRKSIPVLPWMRSPVDVSLFEECPLEILPSLDPRQFPFLFLPTHLNFQSALWLQIYFYYFYLIFIIYSNPLDASESVVGCLFEDLASSKMLFTFKRAQA